MRFAARQRRSWPVRTGKMISGWLVSLQGRYPPGHQRCVRGAGWPGRRADHDAGARSPAAEHAGPLTGLGRLRPQSRRLAARSASPASGRVAASGPRTTRAKPAGLRRSVSSPYHPASVRCARTGNVCHRHGKAQASCVGQRRLNGNARISSPAARHSCRDPRVSGRNPCISRGTPTFPIRLHSPETGAHATGTRTCAFPLPRPVLRCGPCRLRRRGRRFAVVGFGAVAGAIRPVRPLEAGERHKKRRIRDIRVRRGLLRSVSEADPEPRGESLLYGGFQSGRSSLNIR